VEFSLKGKHQVGDLLPKGRVGVLADLPLCSDGNLYFLPVFQFPSAHRVKSAIADAMVGESPSAKHCLPLTIQTKIPLIDYKYNIMYRKVFTPNEQDNSIPLTIPREWYGQLIEVIAFPLVDTNDGLPLQNSVVQNRRKKREKLLEKYLTDLSGFKFNRDEANDYD
jgi:hypothetical protein